MSTRLPFRAMRHTLRTAQAHCAMLLGIREVEWLQKDYVAFQVMSEMTKATHNPTWGQYYTITITWLRFERRLIKSLPENVQKEALLNDFEQLSDGYVLDFETPNVV